MRVDARYAAAILTFERENREYFAHSITDRGDDYFSRFSEWFDEALAEQDAGSTRLHVLVDDDGEVRGRFNLYEIDDASAVLGYRMAQCVTGRGVATDTVRTLCRRAASDYGLLVVRAATSHDNVASTRVLVKAGFVEEGPALLAGRPGNWYRRDLADVTQSGHP